MAVLFEIKEKVGKELLKEIREDEWKGEDYCKEMYSKYGSRLPFRRSDFEHFKKDELIDIIHCMVEWVHINRENLYKVEKINERDLSNLLNTQIEMCYDEFDKALKTNGVGLSFINYFIKEKLLSVTVKGNGSNTVMDILDDYKKVYKVVIKTIQLVKTGIITLNSILNTSRLVGTQTVSNFRPLSSAYIMYKYGILKNKDKNELNFWIPSEGWLGRMLSSYYIAYNNPDKQINYISTDPSGDVVSSFWEAVEWLKDYGGISKVKNWHPEIRQHGSEVEEARFKVREDKMFDLIWTSPPYSLGYEMYKDSYKIIAVDSKGKKVKIKDKNDNYLSEMYTMDDGKRVKEINCGEKFVYCGEEYTLFSKRSLGQSHSKAITNNGWNEIFFRPTVRNCLENLYDSGTMIWNVANVRSHMTLEDDVKRICDEEGFTLIDTIKYSLSRVPGEAVVDGKKVSIKEYKPNYEPVFIFEKKK